MSVISSLPYESAIDPAPPTNALRVLPPADSMDLPRRDRWLAGAFALLLAIAYFAYIYQYWAPAHSGVDQNGYLVGGRMLAATGSTGLKPENDLGFIGAMWVRNDATGVNYPKYPIGLPLLYAIPLWIFGSDPGGLGVRAAFLVSPIGAALSALGTYFLARQFAGIFGAMSAMLLMMFSQLTLSLANNPNSHAACLACVIWGTFLLLRFWETSSIWRGLLGGFLLGYAVTIRYTEGLLGLLIAIVILSMVRYRNWRDWRGLLRVITPALGWAIPVAYLVIFNLVAMGTPTGYDTTNESKPGSAFTIEHITQNWEKLIRQVHDTAMFFSLPLALLGMLLAFRVSARRALILWFWLLPGVLTYMAYYWAPDRGVSYLRFFLTMLPPLAVGVGVTIDQVQRLASDRLQRVFLPVGGGIVVILACGLGLYRGILGIEDGVETGQGLEGQYRQNANLAQLGAIVTKAVPPGSTLIGSTNELHYLQFAGNYDCFSTETFTTNFVNRLRSMEDRVDAEVDPMTQQPARRRFLLSKLEGKDEEALLGLEVKVVQDALDAGRKVFVVLGGDAANTLIQKMQRVDSTLRQEKKASFHEFGRLRPEDPNLTPQQQQQARQRGGPGNMRNTRRGAGNFGGGPPGGGGGGPGGPPGGFGRRDGIPQVYQIVEITRTPPVPKMEKAPGKAVESRPERTEKPVPPPEATIDDRMRQRRAEVPPTTAPSTDPAPASLEQRLRERRTMRATTSTSTSTSRPSTTRPADAP